MTVERIRGKWRIVEMPKWGADHLNLLGPAYIEFDGKGGGEIAFGRFRRHSNAQRHRAASTSTGMASTRWTKSAARVGSNSRMTSRSSASSPITMATNQISEPSLGEFFNSLLAAGAGSARGHRRTPHRCDPRL
jgi:hypothetical protein